MSITSERLKSARERKGLKQTQVKERTGINNKTLSGYEKSVSEPDLKTLKVLAELYEVSVDWLVGKVDEPVKEEKLIVDKLNNAVPIDEIAKEHELSYRGHVLNDDEKKWLLSFLETAIKMKNSVKKE